MALCVPSVKKKKMLNCACVASSSSSALKPNSASRGTCECETMVRVLGGGGGGGVGTRFFLRVRHVFRRRWTRLRRCGVLRGGASCLVTLLIVCSFFLLVVLLLLLLGFWASGWPWLRNALAGDLVDFSGADNVSGFSWDIVPDVVHYVKLGPAPTLSFVEFLSIRSVQLHHRPSRILIHCSHCNQKADENIQLQQPEVEADEPRPSQLSMKGKYWSALRCLERAEGRRWLGMKGAAGRVEVVSHAQPTHVFGRPLSSVYHASDVTRLHVMGRWGGIFLDGDVIVLKSLKPFLKFECSIGWPIGQFIGSQVLIAHRNSRFLKLWLNSYRSYRPFMWYYNAGQLPTEDILALDPSLVHRVPVHFGVHYLVDDLYKRASMRWEDYYTVHLLARHRTYLDSDSDIHEFDEENVKRYNRTFGMMARKILYNTTDLLPTTHPTHTCLRAATTTDH